MQFNLNRPALDIIVSEIAARNNAAILSSDVTSAILVPYAELSGDEQLTVTSQITHVSTISLCGLDLTFAGSTRRFYYGKIDINKLMSMKRPVVYVNNLNSDTILAAINDYYSIKLTNDDVAILNISTISAQVQSKPTSLLFYGSITLEIRQGSNKLQDIVSNDVLGQISLFY